MFKKLILAFTALLLTMGMAFAQVDVNKGDQAALDGIKGIGPAKSKLIIEERTKNGNFKDWADFEARVKGVKDKSAAKLSEAGLTVNGQSRSGAAARASEAAKKDSKAAAKADAKMEAKAETKSDMKADAKAMPKEVKKTDAKVSASK